MWMYVGILYVGSVSRKYSQVWELKHKGLKKPKDATALVQGKMLLLGARSSPLAGGDRGAYEVWLFIYL